MQALIMLNVLIVWLCVVLAIRFSSILIGVVFLISLLVIEVLLVTFFRIVREHDQLRDEIQDWLNSNPPDDEDDEPL